MRHKWLVQYDREYQTKTWLDCEDSDGCWIKSCEQVEMSHMYQAQ